MKLALVTWKGNLHPLDPAVKEYVIVKCTKHRNTENDSRTGPGTSYFLPNPHYHPINEADGGEMPNIEGWRR